MQERTELEVSDFLMEEDLLCQAAEEAVELAHAALKLARIVRGMNPTPVGYELAKAKLTEETADILVAIEQLQAIDWKKVDELRDVKLERWLSRLTEQRRKEEEQRYQVQHGFTMKNGG